MRQVLQGVDIRGQGPADGVLQGNGCGGNGRGAIEGKLPRLGPQVVGMLDMPGGFRHPASVPGFV